MALKHLFEVIHRREDLSATGFERELLAARDRALQAGLNNVPPTRNAQNMANRFRKHGEAYLTFVTTPGVEPTITGPMSAVSSAKSSSKPLGMEQSIPTLFPAMRRCWRE